MKTNNGDMPAMPISEEETDRVDDGVKIYTGLTKREHFAAMFMQGIISAWRQHDVADFSDSASDAVMAADALLKELAK